MLFNKGKKMSRGLILFWLTVSMSPLWAQTPCSGIDRDLGLSPEQIVRMKENISPQVFSTDLEILNVFKAQGWSVLSINPNKAEPAYLFFSSNLLTSHYVGLWAGAYGEMTRSELVVAFQKEAAGIPENLAQCVAWFLTDRGKLTGVFSSMESHPDTADILGDEMIISQAEGAKYWVIYQHAKGR